MSGGAAVTLNSGATMSAQTITMAGGATILLGGNAVTKLLVGSGGLRQQAAQLRKDQADKGRS